MLKKLIPCLSIAVLFQSCKVLTLPVAHTEERPYAARENVLAVFMDGTNNKIQKGKKIHTNTHVQRLHHLADTNFRSLYVEGVGVRWNIPGLLWGTGTRERVAIAYCFLSEYYKPKDTIALFGFSRGANQCRILSNLIYTFGLMDLSKIDSDKVKHKLIKKCYDKYTGYKSLSRKKKKIAAYLTKWNDRHPDRKVGFDTASKEKIKLAGLWDTVEAFNLDGDGELSAPLSRHLNQLKSVENTFQAASLDDNRSDIYTPILLHDKRVLIDTPHKFEEVWFSGSHRDIGGGPNKKPELSTVSLKWMLEKTKSYNFFRDTSFTVYPLGAIHNAAAWPIWWPMGGNRSINLYHYGIDLGKGKIKIHQSVIDRLRDGYAPRFKYWFVRKDWYEKPPFKYCFDVSRIKVKRNNRTVSRRSVTLKPGYDCPCIEIDQTPLTSLKISHLTGDFYVYTTYNTYKGTPYPANGMYLVTNDGVVMIDSPWDTTQFQPLLDSIKARHNKNVVICIATHFHEDRTGGLEYYKQQGIKTYTTIQTDELSKKRGMKQAGFLIKNDTTFKVGQYSFQVYYPGPGHAPDNIVVWFENEKILYGGCLIKSVDDKTLGNLADANEKEYATTIKNVQQKCLYPKYVIPGHNGWRDKGSLEHTLKMAEELKPKISN